MWKRPGSLCLFLDGGGRDGIKLQVGRRGWQHTKAEEREAPIKGTLQLLSGKQAQVTVWVAGGVSRSVNYYFMALLQNRGKEVIRRRKGKKSGGSTGKLEDSNQEHVTFTVGTGLNVTYTLRS